MTGRHTKQQWEPTTGITENTLRTRTCSEQKQKQPDNARNKAPYNMPRNTNIITSKQIHIKLTNDYLLNGVKAVDEHLK